MAIPAGVKVMPRSSNIQKLLGWCGGAVGLFLRQWFYPSMFKRCGKKVLFGRGVTFRFPDRMTIGSCSVISDGSFFDAENFQGEGLAITLGDHIFIGIRNQIICAGGSITIDAGANIGSRCRVVSRHGVTIGKNTLLAAYVTIGQDRFPGWSQDAGFTNTDAFPRTPVFIGSDCWLGVRVHVHDGIQIGNGTIVGAHSEVSIPIDEYVVTVGSPAYPIKSRK